MMMTFFSNKISPRILLFYQDKGNLYLFILMNLIILVILALHYIGYPFPTDDSNYDKNDSLLIIHVVEQKTAWDNLWNQFSHIDPNKDVIVQINDKLPEDNRNLLNNLFKKGLAPAGDTFFMRRPGTLPLMPPHIVRIFQAITLVNEDTKLAELALLAKNPDKIIRYRALLENARFRFKRLNKKDRIELSKVLNNALEIELPDHAWKSDIWFLLGKWYGINERYGKAKAALEKAIELDPFFVDARWALVKMQLNHIGGNNKLPDSKKCLAVSAQLIKNIERIALLAQDGTLFGDIALELDKLTHDSPIKYFAIGYCLYFAKDTKKAKESLKMAQKHSYRLPRYCGNEVAKKAALIIKRMEK